MFRITHKFEAFTLLELIVAMFLGSILFSMMFSIYTIVNRQYISYNQLTDSQIELDFWVDLLEEDIYKAEKLYLNENVLNCFFKNHIILYRKKNNTWIRVHNHYLDNPDTLQFACKSLIFYNNNSMIQTGVIDQIKATIIFFDREFYIDVRKKYTAQEQLNTSLNYGF